MHQHKQWVQSVFDKAAPEYGEKGCTFFDYFGQRLVEKACLAKGAHVLDVATGKGAVLIPAAQQVGPQGSITGIDISPKMIEETQKKVHFPWVSLQVMDAEQLSFPDNSFDAVLCGFAVFFFPDVAKGLSEFRRVLKPGGKLAISIFGKKSELDEWLSQRAKELGSTRKLGTINLESKEAFTSILEKTGFQSIVVEKEMKTFWYESPQLWWESLWTHGMRSQLEQLTKENLALLQKEAIEKASQQSSLGKVPQNRLVFYASATKSF